MAATAPKLEPDQHGPVQHPTLVPDPPDSSGPAEDANHLDPNQGRKVGADPYDDPTQRRKIGADGYHDSR